MPMLEYPMKKIILGVIVLLVLLVGGVLLNRAKPTSEVADSTAAATLAETQTSPTTQNTSLKNLLAMNKSQKCTFDTEYSSGTTYISSGKMRGDFSAKAGGQTQITHMIADGQTSYMWMEGQTTGYQMNFSAMQGNTTKGEVNNTGQVNVDPSQSMNYNCSNWPTDASVFALPKNIQFTDMSAMMDTYQTPPTIAPIPGNDNMDQMTAACNKLPEPAKTQCLASMKK